MKITDKMRLDFIQKSWTPNANFFVGKHGSVFRGSGSDYRRSLRLAIDEAMKEAERRRPGGED